MKNNFLDKVMNNQKMTVSSVPHAMTFDMQNVTWKHVKENLYSFICFIDGVEYPVLNGSLQITHNLRQKKFQCIVIDQHGEKAKRKVKFS